MNQSYVTWRMFLGGAIWGSLLGFLVGSLLGTIYGILRGDIALGLDGAIWGSGILTVLGAGYGWFLSRSTRSRQNHETLAVRVPDESNS
ncbi:MAG: hypothetical protein ACK4RK_21585 [Gemmataceae bacterium]